MSLLEIRNLSFSYRKDKPLLKDVSLNLEKGDIFCLIGPNGSGKTTFMSQILFPTKGNQNHILIDGMKASKMSLINRAKCFGYIPQKIPFPHLSVIQAVVMGRYPFKKGISLKADKTDLDESFNALEIMGLSSLADRQLNTLSGGEIQRVFIAQSIVKQAKIYFFDEPMSALDPEYQADFLKTITWLSKQGATIVFSTHNPNHLFSLNAKKRVGIIDRYHQFKEIDMNTTEGIRNIESAYNDTVSIVFSQSQKQYVALFKC